MTGEHSGSPVYITDLFSLSLSIQSMSEESFLSSSR